MLAYGEQEVAFNGEYLEIVPGERLRHTEVYEGAPGSPAVVTVTFEPAAEGSFVTIHVQHETKSERDAHIESGMEDGLQDALDLLEQAVSTAG
jgi:uncharacterized protein YndB with AHSA1/START domain